MNAPKVAKTIEDWFTNYASVYEFDATTQFDQITLEELKAASPEEVWTLLAPTLQQLVSDYLTAGIEDKENN